jgi:hypothetical protein
MTYFTKFDYGLIALLCAAMAFTIAYPLNKTACPHCPKCVQAITPPTIPTEPPKPPTNDFVPQVVVDIQDEEVCNLPGLQYPDDVPLSIVVTPPEQPLRNESQVVHDGPVAFT